MRPLLYFCPRAPHDELGSEAVPSTVRRAEGYERDPAAELDALLTAAVDAVVTIDEKSRILSFNPAAERLFQYDKADTIGKTVDMLMPEPYRREHAGYVARYLATGVPRIIGTGREVVGCRRDGSTFPIWVSVGVAKTAQGRRFVGIITDLTEQRRVEREQLSLEARLAHVARFSLMGEMAAGIAHEINQPLSAIANYAQAGKRLLQSEHPDMELLKDSCDRIADQAHRAAEVIQNLRRFVRKQEPSRQVVDVNAAINDVMGLIEADARSAGVRLTIELEEGLPPVRANAVQLQQVVLNLTRNAVDALRAVRGDEPRLTVRTYSTDDDQLRITVSDNGSGVDAAVRDEVFMPFVTTKADGMGVGLAISRTIVEAHAGRLAYVDNPQGGASFTVTLPILEDDAQ